MKLNDRYLMFREEDTGGGGGSDNEPSKGDAAFQEEAPQPSKDPAKEPTDDPPKAPQVDAAALAKEFADSLKGLVDRPREEKPLTAEEAKKLLEYPEIDDDFIKEFGNIETQKKAFQKLVEKLLRHVHIVNGMQRRELTDELEGKFKPALEYVTKAEQRERDADFDKAYPVLAKAELKPLIKAVQDSLKNEKFASPQDHFKAVAEGVAAVIRVTTPDFKLTDGSNPSPKKNDRSGGLPTTTPGSGGGGGGGNAQPAKSRGQAVFS